MVAVGLSPVMPSRSRKGYAGLDIEEECDDLKSDCVMPWSRFEAGMLFKKPKPVFHRMELPAPVEPEPAVD